VLVIHTLGGGDDPQETSRFHSAAYSSEQAIRVICREFYRLY
jgi:hypothetical protein